ncbi:ATP-grasp domain-containing protein [Bifidobacterium callitrichidarum]|uniref:ATP-grasp domain-containing protein n=1 Tax=Bifidobacterium callitrichidarum TaxID=2052941 RepID=UPI001304ECA1|nr:ATP-grasp domain-containing protein [Bifidobacterium callitrichidarum]
MNDWLIDVIPVKAPDDMTGIPNRYTDVWRKYVGEPTPAGGDREKWVEQAARLEASTRLLDNPTVRITGRSYKNDPEMMRMPHYGTIPYHPTLDQLLAQRSNADQYADFTSLRPYLGRDVALAACSKESVDGAVKAMLVAHPGDGVVVKFAAKPKYCPPAFIDSDGMFMHVDPFEPDAPARRIPFDLWTWNGGAFSWEGEPDAILVQQRVRMRWEYRIHVIGGEVVCGAGCIERYTPADNRGERFDPRMEEIRNDGSIESHPPIVELYAEYAREVAKTIASDVTGPYVIDLYVGDDGRPHVIELNSQTNAGLYALDMDILLDAVNRHPEEYSIPDDAPAFGLLSRLVDGPITDMEENI